LNQVTVYPNPVAGVLNISFDLNKSTATKIEIIDLSGKQVLVLNNEISNGLVTKQIKTDDFKSGIYFVKIQTENESITKKISVIR